LHARFDFRAKTLNPLEDLKQGASQIGQLVSVLVEPLLVQIVDLLCSCSALSAAVADKKPPTHGMLTIAARRNLRYRR
jgi:hypothetical protein